MKFGGLYLSGFKSFPHPTEIAIEDGLTGVVGPNGCGKSNLVEALCWVMGESAPGKVRLGEMSEVVFAGTDKRPPRNLAEVRLNIKDANGSKWANGGGEIEVSRRLERGGVSKWLINEKVARATDVALLLADAATGARTAAIISQGEVSRLVRCNPSERRALLEEAAGVSGIRSRRGEAASKLKAAETNLIRVGDLAKQLQEQHSALALQARRAERHKRLREGIRRLRGQQLWHDWRQAKENLEKSRLTLAAALQKKSQTERAAQQATTELEKRRNNERNLADKLAAAEKIFNGKEIEAGKLEQAYQNWQRRLAEAETHRVEWQTDLESAVAGERAAAEGMKNAEQELSALKGQSRAEGDPDLAKLQRKKQILLRRLEEIESAARGEEERRKKRLEAQLRVESLQKRLQGARHAAAAYRARLAEGEKRLKGLETMVGRARRSLAAAEAEAASAATAAKKSQLVVAKLELALKRGSVSLPDGVKTEPGFENAVAVCLAATDFPAPWGWRDQGGSRDKELRPGPSAESPPLPKGAKPIDSVVIAAPSHIKKRLAFCGLVNEERVGHAVAAELKAGQRLVSSEGALWRWDGYCAPPLGRGSFLAAQNAARRAEAAAEAAVEKATAASAALRESTARAERAKAELALPNGDPVAEVTSELKAAVAEMENLGKDAPSSSETKKIQLLNEQAALTAELEARSAEIATRDRRRQKLEEEKRRWQSALTAAENRIRSLEERRERTEALLSQAGRVGYQKRIEANKRETENAAAALAAAKAAHNRSSDELAELAARSSSTEEEMSMAGQEWARAEAAAKPAAEEAERRYRELLEEFPQDPQNLPGSLGFGPEPPPAGEGEKLRRQLEAMGEINLRAATDFKETDKRLVALKKEQDELFSAIAKLRRALSRLKGEESRRMSSAFKSVNRYFAELFAELFVGGQAELREVNEEEGIKGLEILARLPGRKRQRLSALSGGEQALVALALVFAVFLSNPGPICVLDEVDAPLDDANADKFCGLLSRVNAKTGSPIIVVTHRPLTMSAMTRLQGVTMAEKGISDLITVDLERALKFAS